MSGVPLGSATVPSRPAARPTPVTVTVAICTHERPEKLARALASLHCQIQPADEVLVVDNAPGSTRTRELVREEYPRVRYIVEPVRGLDFARNRALHEARHSIVAFLDDDAVAAPDWVQATREAFSNRPHLGMCNGLVEPLTLETAGQRLFEANGGFGRGNDRICLPRDRARGIGGRPAPLVAWAISAGYGCSMAVRREAVLRLGGFDEALDLGRELPGGGDLDMLWRLLDGGWEVVYEPRVRALHEHRRELDAAVSQIVGHNRALIAWLCKSLFTSSVRRKPEVLLFLAWRLVKPGVRIAARLAGRDALSSRMLLRLWLHCWLGLVSYPRARWLAARRRRSQQFSPASIG